MSLHLSRAIVDHAYYPKGTFRFSVLAGVATEPGRIEGQSLLRDRQVEFGEDLLHVLPDLSTIIRRVIAQQISSVICRHKLYGRPADPSVVFVELTSQLTYRLGAVEQRPGCMSAESDENLRFNYLNLSLEVGQAAYYLVGPGVAIARRATLQYVAYEDVASLEPAGGDYLVQQLASPAYEGSPLSVLVGAGGFSDEHYAGVGIALAWHGIGPRRSQATLAALTDLPGDFLQFSGFLGNSHIILLILSFGIRTLESKTGKKLFHLEVLANNFAYVHIVSHCHEL